METRGLFFSRRAARRGTDGARPFCHYVTSPHTMGSHHGSQIDCFSFAEKTKSSVLYGFFLFLVLFF